MTLAIDRIVGVLATLPNGATRTELQARTGLSPATITSAINSMHLTKVTERRPYRYAMPGSSPTEPTPTTPTSPDTVAVKRHTEWDVSRLIPSWNGMRVDLSTLWNDDDLKQRPLPTDKPQAIADKLMRMASALASMAATLSEHADRPDWYTVLGGDSDTP